MTVRLLIHLLVCFRKRGGWGEGISTLLFQILIDRGMTEEERMQFYRGFILWQQEGLDIEKYPCLIINFGINMRSSLEWPLQRRSVIMILRVISLNFLHFY